MLGCAISRPGVATQGKGKPVAQEQALRLPGDQGVHASTAGEENKDQVWRSGEEEEAGGVQTTQSLPTRRQ